MFFSRIPRVSRFNARVFAYEQCFATPRARRMTFGIALTVVGLIGTIALWPARPPEQRAEDRKVAWESFAPRRVVTTRSRKPVAARPVVANSVAARPVVPPKPAVSSAAVVRTTASAAPKPTAPRTEDPLGPLYVDEVNGFSIRFPARWAMRATAGTRWLLDCGDPNRGMISVGFSSPTRDPEQTTSATRGTNTLHARGSATISGRKATWSKITGPLDSSAPKRVTRITYVLPVAKGRAVEVRVAATPQEFEAIAPLMKQSVATLRLTPRAARSQMLATTD